MKGAFIPSRSAETAGESGNEPADRERLFTWKLCPEPGRGADVWPQVEYRGVVVVRAHDPVQARGLAAEKLIGSSTADTSRAGRINPWGRRALVRIERISDPPYDQIEVPAVVYP
jgi:hypothetical protein